MQSSQMKGSQLYWNISVESFLYSLLSLLVIHSWESLIPTSQRALFCTIFYIFLCIFIFPGSPIYNFEEIPHLIPHNTRRQRSMASTSRNAGGKSKPWWWPFKGSEARGQTEEVMDTGDRFSCDRWGDTDHISPCWSGISQFSFSA